MHAADTHRMPRNEHGFTLIELLVVMVILAILVAIAVGFQTGARTRAGDATARANIRIAEPATAMYFADNGVYTGMTITILQNTYSRGVQGINVLAADASSYCISSTVDGRSWYKNGPGAPITSTACP